MQHGAIDWSNISYYIDIVIYIIYIDPSGLGWGGKLSVYTNNSPFHPVQKTLESPINESNLMGVRMRANNKIRAKNLILGEKNELCQAID